MFEKITEEHIAGFLARMEAIKKLDPKGYVDNGPTALYHALQELYVKKSYTVLHAALNELEKLYKLNEKN